MTSHSNDSLVQSIQDRLRNEARTRGRPYAELVELYAIERFLHRLGNSRHRENFILKGALLLRIWLGVDTRPTRDIDLLGPSDLEEETLRSALEDILKVHVEPDGIEFDLESIAIKPIRAESPVSGLRAKFDARLGRTRLRYQVDAGRGDEVYPPPEDVIPGELLGLDLASVRAYTPYTTVAEKLEAMVILGGANSRLKDYYDLVQLSMHLEFDGALLVEAVNRTFEKRGTSIDAIPLVGLSDAFGSNTLNAQRWETFHSRSKLDTDEDLPAAIARIREFVDPVLMAVRGHRTITATWPPRGPWND